MAETDQAARQQLLLNKWALGLDGVLHVYELTKSIYTTTYKQVSGGSSYASARWACSTAKSTGSHGQARTISFPLVPLGEVNYGGGYGSCDWASFTVVAEFLFNFVYSAASAGVNISGNKAFFFVGDSNLGGTMNLSSHGCGFELQATGESSYDIYPIWRNTPNQDRNITAVTATAPIVVTSAGHRLEDGDRVAVNLVGGVLEANGTWIVRNPNAGAGTFELEGSSGSGTYTANTGGWHEIGPAPLASVDDARKLMRVVMVCSGGVASFYINGVLAGTGEAPSSSKQSGAGFGVWNHASPATGAVNLYCHKISVGGFIPSPAP